MGIAIIVPNVSFASANLGQVTVVGGGSLQSISIDGPSSVVGTTDAATFDVIYNPTTTADRGVTWSIVTGSSYASIDSSTGEITILSGASYAEVTIRATSTVDPTIYADKTIHVTYAGPIENLVNYALLSQAGAWYTDIIITGEDTVKVVATSSSLRDQCIVGSRTASDADDNSSTIEIDHYNIGHYGIKCKIAGKYFYSQQAVTPDTKYCIQMSTAGASCTPSLGGFVTGSDLPFTQGVPIAVGQMYTQTGTMTKYAGKFYGLEITRGGTLIHRLEVQPNLFLVDVVTGQSYALSGTAQYGTDTE